MKLTIYIPSFWTAVCRFAYRRAVSGKKVPHGLPGHRDPEHRCDMYDPRPDLAPGECVGDGHYLCRECSHFDAERHAAFAGDPFVAGTGGGE